MKVCLPIKDEKEFQIYNDINNTPNIIIFDTNNKNYIVKDTSKMILGNIIQYLIDNKVDRIIATVNTMHHHKYISCKDIIIYKPDYSVNAFYNMDLFMCNNLKIDKKEH